MFSKWYCTSQKDNHIFVICVDFWSHIFVLICI